MKWSFLIKKAVMPNEAIIIRKHTHTQCDIKI